MSVLRGQEKHVERVCVSIREGAGKMGDSVVLSPSLSIPCYVHVPHTLHWNSMNLSWKQELQTWRKNGNANLCHLETSAFPSAT